MKNENIDILDILGISTREDSFTDILSFLFEHNTNFKEIFLNFIGKSSVNNLECIEMNTRKKYNGKSPDIVIVDKSNEEIIVIEVKVLASQGKNQLKNYNKILKSIWEEHFETKTYSEEKVKLRYLSINDRVKDEELTNFENLFWGDFYQNLKVSKDNQKSELTGYQLILYDALLTRLKPLNEMPQLNFNNVINGDGWLAPSEIIGVNMKNFISKNLLIRSIYYSFDTITQKYVTTIMLSKEKWFSGLIQEDCKKLDFKKHFDFHIELKVYEDKDGNVGVLTRFDLHTNPYKSTRAIKKESFEADCYYEDRLSFLTKIIDKFSNDEMFVESKVDFNRRNKSYLYLFKKDESYLESKFNNFYDDLGRTIEHFEKMGDKVVEEFLVF